MALRGGNVVEQARGLQPRDLDVASDEVRRQAPQLRLGPEGQIRAYHMLLDMASREREAYALLRKLILDSAKEYMNASMGAVSAALGDDQVVKSLVYNAGAWQALMLVALRLDPAEMEKRLADLQRGSPRMEGA